MLIKDLIEGNAQFRKKRFHKYEQEFKELVEKGQNPDILFISCSDSRITPSLLFNTRPGDMFVLRNVGNFVPPYKLNDDYHGSSAAIEYAVKILNVKHIIICGHSNCGACQSLYQNFDDEPELTHIRKWLDLGNKPKQHVLSIIKDKNDKEKLYKLTEKISIIYQLENLKTFPYIKKKLEDKTIQIHGWYYKIEDGSIQFYDEIEEKFKPLSDNYES